MWLTDKQICTVQAAAKSELHSNTCDGLFIWCFQSRSSIKVVPKYNLPSITFNSHPDIWWLVCHHRSVMIWMKAGISTSGWIQKSNWCTWKYWHGLIDEPKVVKLTTWGQRTFLGKNGLARDFKTFLIVLLALDPHRLRKQQIMHSTF